MIIEKRNEQLKYPMAIKEDKMRIVLDWLLEFRFSTREVLAARLGQSANDAGRFFNRIVSQGFIFKFRNVHTKFHDFFMLTLSGVSYLEACGRDISKACTRSNRLSRYSQILHDLAVQKAVLGMLDGHQSVVCDRNIDFLGDGAIKPDVIMTHKNGYNVAVEYERWRKESKRIFASFERHLLSLQDGHYAGVYYLFDQLDDKNFYENLFRKDEWPRYKVDRRTGRIKRVSGIAIYPDDDFPEFREAFVFQHQPLS